MANTSSAKKAIRVSARRGAINLRRKRNTKSARKEVEKSIAAKDKKGAEKLLPKAYKEIDKAVKGNIIHKKAASRYKSRMAAKIKNI